MEATKEIAEAEESVASPNGLMLRLRAMLRAAALIARVFKQRIAARLQRARLDEVEETAASGKAADVKEHAADEDVAAAPRIHWHIHWRMLWSKLCSKLWPALPIYIGVLLLGASVGAIGAYSYCTKTLLSTQNAEVARQREVIARQSKFVAEAQQKIAAQQAKRIAAENRLALMLSSGERAAQRESQAYAGATTAQRGAAQASTGDCKLRKDNLGVSLKDCIADFNRQ